MAQRCPSCGGDVFLGETRCPACKAPITGAAEAARQAGVDLAPGPTGPRGATGGPPPEGLSMIVQKGLADQDVRREHERRLREEDERYTGKSLGSTFDDIADMTRASRDGQGNVIWDWKHALIGGIVVAVVVGLLAFVAYSYVNRTSTTLTRLRPSTTTTLAR